MEWPPIPTDVRGVMGPIVVTLVEQPKGDDGDECEGTWCMRTRTIEVKRSPHPLNEWFTFWHEWTHAVIADLNIKMPLATEERVCDGVAHARVREMQDGL